MKKISQFRSQIRLKAKEASSLVLPHKTLGINTCCNVTYGPVWLKRPALWPSMGIRGTLHCIYYLLLDKFLPPSGLGLELG